MWSIRWPIDATACNVVALPWELKPSMSTAIMPRTATYSMPPAHEPKTANLFFMMRPFLPCQSMIVEKDPAVEDDAGNAG
jgi:hypothetical protein